MGICPVIRRARPPEAAALSDLALRSKALWGYDARFMALCRVELTVLGAERLTLDADPNAVAFYERMGLRIVGQSPSGSIPGRVLPRMAKTLVQ